MPPSPRSLSAHRISPSPLPPRAWRAACGVGCFRPPSVPDGVSRLRLTARADLTDADLERLRDVLSAVRREVLA